MQVQIAAVADGANVTLDGKLNIFGIFDAIQVARLPAVLPDLVLAVRLVLDFMDGGRTHSLGVALVDEDGAERLRLGQDVQVPPIEAGGSLTLHRVVQLRQLQVDSASPIQFVVLWGGERVAAVEVSIQGPAEGDDGEAAEEEEG